jgi:hypothetical protein
MVRALGIVALALAIAGCDSLLGIQDLSGPDGGGGGGVPAQISVSGTIRINQPGQPAYQAVVELVHPDGTIARSAMTAATGQFVLTEASGGMPLDVALHIAGQDPDARDEHVYFPAPLVADRDVGTVVVLLDGDVQAVTSEFGYTYTQEMTLDLVRVHDASGTLTGGATVVPQPSSVTVRYTSGGTPSQGNMTTSDGVAYVFDYNTQVTSLAITGSVAVPARHVRGIPAGLLLVDLQP